MERYINRMSKQKSAAVDYSQLVENYIIVNQFIDKITNGDQQVLWSKKMMQTATDPVFLSQIPEEKLKENFSRLVREDKTTYRVPSGYKNYEKEQREAYEQLQLHLASMPIHRTAQ